MESKLANRLDLSFSQAHYQGTATAVGSKESRKNRGASRMVRIVLAPLVRKPVPFLAFFLLESDLSSDVMALSLGFGRQFYCPKAISL